MLTIFSRISSLKSLLLPVLVLGLAFFLNACGGEEEPTPESLVKNTPPTESTPPVAEEEVAPPPGLKMGEHVPDTLSVLRFMPEEAQVALGLPSIPGMRDKALPLLRLLDSEEDIDEAMAEAIFDLGDELGVQAETYEELAAALGVDAQAPLGLFLDITRTVTSAIAAKEAEEALPKEKASDTPDSTSEQAVTPSDGVEANESLPEMPTYLEKSEEPAWVAVLGLADPAKARAALERIADDDKELSSLPKSTETVDGMKLSVRGPYAFFTTDTHLLFGDLELIKGAVRRIKNPATFRYGTVECPATASDEVALLIYGNRFLPLLDKALPLMQHDIDDSMLPYIQSQIDLYKGLFAQGEQEDPIVATLSWVEDRLEMLSRIDTKANPGILKVVGEAQPLRLARYLPENTLAMLSLRFNEVFKKQIMESVLPAVQAGGGADVSMAAQIIPQLGDELTLGITDLEEGMAGIYLMLGLAQPEATKGILQMFLPMEGGVEHKGYTINSVPIPAPISLHLSFVDDFILAGTSEEGLKAIIDHHVAKEASGLFAAMEPPFDIDLPRYQALNFSTALLGDALESTANSFGGDIEDAESITNLIIAILRELRAAKELNGGWMNGRMTLYFNDLEAAAAKLKAIPKALEAEKKAATAPVEQ